MPGTFYCISLLSKGAGLFYLQLSNNTYFFYKNSIF
jgi:hypothetical protein